MKNLYAYKIIFFSCALFFSLSIFGKEAPPQYVKDLANQSSDERITYFFILHLRWVDTPLNHARLDSLKNIATELNDKRLQQYILIFEKKNNILLSKSDTEKEDLFLAAEKIVEQSPYKDVKANFYFMTGFDAFYNKNYTKGLPLLLQSKKLLEEAHYEEFPYSVYYYKGFFDMYYYFEDYKSAADYCQLAIKYPNHELYESLGFYNNLGLCYLKIKDYDKAKASFQEGIAEAEKSGNTNFKALIVGNLGNVLRKQGQYKEALPYLYQDAFANEKAIPENAAISRMYIAHALLQLDSVGKAKQYMTPPDFVMPIWTWPGYDLIRFETLALYNQKTGNFKLASQYKDSLIGFKDTLRVLFDAKKLTVLEASLTAEKNLNDKRESEIKAQNAQLVRNLIIIGLILLFGAIVYLFYNRYKQEKLLELEKQKQIDALHELDIAKTRFYANVSHELRTPLTLMLAPLSTMIKSDTLDNRNFTLASLVRQNAQGLLKLLNEILDLNKLEARKLELNEEKTVVYNLIRRIVANFESAAEIQNIHFVFTYEADKYLQLMIDTHKFEKIVNNLLSNALKFTKSNGAITVKVMDVVNSLHLSVTDTGCGIHPDDLPNIFNRFYQSNQADALIEGGTGIGLSLSAELTRLLGGTLAVDSVWGEGSTFYLALPKKEVLGTIDPTEAEEMLKANAALVTLQPPTPLSIESHKSSNGSQKTLLIVEDNRSLQDYLTLILQPHFNILKAENGQVALQMMNDFLIRNGELGNPNSQFLIPNGKLPDLILSDVMMPIMDGFQLLTALKSNDAYCSIPVVMLTARAELQDKLKALRIGVDDYLVKPFEEEELFARIDNLLKNSQLRRILPDNQALESDDLTVYTEGSLLETVVEMPPISAAEMSWLADLETNVKQNLKDIHYSVERMASDMALSRTQLFRKLKHLTGLSPLQYLQEARLQYALYLLETNQVTTVKNACYDVGLLQVKHFSQLFHERFGKLPSAYL